MLATLHLGGRIERLFRAHKTWVHMTLSYSLDSILDSISLVAVVVLEVALYLYYCLLK